MAEILQKENSLLRALSQDIPVSDITSPRIQKIIKSMKTALDSQHDGVAIAAPQIGESLRLFVVSKRIFEMEIDKGLPPAQDKETNTKKPEYPDLVFINPKIVRLSKQSKLMEEGCLSVRWLYGKVRRSSKIRIRAYDEKGVVFERGASGLMAQVFQHEMDHLDGILFTDKAESVREILPENNHAS